MREAWQGVQARSTEHDCRMQGYQANDEGAAGRAGHGALFTNSLSQKGISNRFRCCSVDRNAIVVNQVFFDAFVKISLERAVAYFWLGA